MSHLQKVQLHVAEQRHRISKRVGVLIAGLGGNNGSSLWALHAMLKQSMKPAHANHPFMLGSLLSLGDVPAQEHETPLALHTLLSKTGFLANFKDIEVISGWEAYSCSLAQSMRENGVIPAHDVRNLTEDFPDEAWNCIPRGIVYPEYIGLHNIREQSSGSMDGDILKIANDIDRFATKHCLDMVIVIYSGCTEKNQDLSDNRIAPSQIYAHGATRSLITTAFINAAAQDTLTPEILQAFDQKGRLALGNDLCTGQTRLKLALLGTFVPQGIPVQTIVNFNTLGNKDGLNLNCHATNASKISSKSSTCDRLTEFAPTLYKNNRREKIDQLVQIAYVPTIGDNKRAMDEYIFGVPFGKQLDMHINTVCPDTALAMGVLIDLILMCGILLDTRVSVAENDEQKQQQTRKITCEEANAICACLLKNPMSQRSKLYFNENRDVLTGFLLELCGKKPETTRHHRLFL